MKKIIKELDKHIKALKIIIKKSNSILKECNKSLKENKMPKIPLLKVENKLCKDIAEFLIEHLGKTKALKEAIKMSQKTEYENFKTCILCKTTSSKCSKCPYDKFSNKANLDFCGCIALRDKQNDYEFGPNRRWKKIVIILKKADK